MNEKTVSFVKTLPPHIHANDSVARRYWGQVGALALPVLVFTFLRGGELLRVLLLCLVSATAFEFLGAKVFSKKEKLSQGEAVLLAVLTAVVMPSKCPFEVIIAGNFLAIVVARELWGGMGAYLFHPVLLARVFLQMCFPGAMGEPMLLGGGIGTAAALGAGGLLLVKQKQGYWETPLLYIAICFFCAAAGAWKGDPFVFFGGVFLTAFFLLADPVAMPLTRGGTRVFVSGAALFSMFLSPQGFSLAAAGVSILLMNLLTPWLDVWLRPVPYQPKPVFPNKEGR